MNSTERKAFLLKHRNKKLKLRWRVLKKHFGKGKSKSISIVEVVRNGTVIRVLKQLQVEAAVMNAKFEEVYFSLLISLIKSQYSTKD